MPIIEVEVLYLGSTIKEGDYIGPGWVQKECDNITEALSGLLCTEHVELPKVERKVSDGRWVVEIKSCCVNHLDLIEKRLDENYKDHKK